MFNDLKKAWFKLSKKSSMLADSDGLYVVIPNDVFERFEQEFNICFVEAEEDKSFKYWQEKYED